MATDPLSAVRTQVGQRVEFENLYVFDLPGHNRMRHAFALKEFDQLI